MQKNFASWNSVKAALNAKDSATYFYEREVWWVAIGHNVGSEEDGKGHRFARPVLVLRKFNQNLFYGLPLTSRLKTGRYYHSVNVAGRHSALLLSHMRDYDSRRLLDKIGSVDEDGFQIVQQKLAAIIMAPVR